MAAPLRGDHCQCPTCGDSFNSTYAFDKHRVGPYTHDLETRRCLSPDEMRVAGMTKNAAGWWIAARLSDRYRASSRPPRTADRRPILRGQSCIAAEISATPYPTSSPDHRRSCNPQSVVEEAA
jgi:hypothetical protein